MKADGMGSLSAASWGGQMAADWAARWARSMAVGSAARLEEKKAVMMAVYSVYVRVVC
jgi:hypothetical protein